MPTIGSGMVSGIFDFWVARRNQLGYGMGTLRTPDSPTVNTVYGAYRTRALISFAAGTPTYEQAQERGGQSLGPQRDLGATAWGQPTITLSRYDEQLDGIVNDYTPDTTTLSAAIFTARNARRSRQVPLVVGIVVGFDSETDPENYLTIIYPNCSMRPAKPGSSQTGGTNPNPLAMQLVCSPAENTGVGPDFADLNLDLADQQDTDFIIRGRYPYYLVTYVGNGVATTFTTPYLPVSSDAAGTVANLISLNGAPASVTTIVPSTGVVTKPAGASNDILQLLIQTQFQVP